MRRIRRIMEKKERRRAKMSRRMFFFDIDGTLIDITSQISVPTPATVESFKQLHAHGDYVILATGRAKAFIPPEVFALGFDGFILSNGGYVAFQDTVIENSVFNREQMGKLESYAERAEAQLMFIEQERAYIKNAQAPCIQEFIRVFEFTDETLRTGWELKNCRPTMGNLVFENAESVDVFKELAADEFDVYSFRDKMLYADVTPKGVSKGRGVNLLIEKLKIPRRHTYAFGDGMNDIQMLQNVEHGFAMGCAKERVKKMARFTTGTCENDGIFNALVLCGVIESVQNK